MHVHSTAPAPCTLHVHSTAPAPCTLHVHPCVPIVYYAARMKLTRRELGRTVLAATVLAPLARTTAQTGSRVAGVRIGAQTWIFRDRPLEQVPAALQKAGLGFVELWSGHVESDARTGIEQGIARDARRERLRTWRLSTPLSSFREIRTAFANAGVTLTSYDIPYRDDWTDEEILRSFEMADALGVKAITSSAGLSVVPRLAKLVGRADLTIAFHNHSTIRENEFATPDDLTSALKVSSKMGVTLDIGHFTAANFDAVKFLEEHHARIHALHVKDRKKDQGAGVPLGEGDAPVKQVLRLLRDRNWDIPAHIEFDYRPADPVAEAAKGYAYCRTVLETK